MLYNSLRATISSLTLGLNMAMSRIVSMHIIIMLLLVLSTLPLIVKAAQQPLVPAMFVFGDSLVDNGNNNYIPSVAKANFYPYGIDFPLGATGRFTNGKTVLDILGDFLGLPFLPPYLNPETTGPAILSGVNYASGAGGILASSGANYVARLSFDQQIRNFESTLHNLTVQLGGPIPTAKYLSKSLFAIVFGSNDYVNNYLRAGSTSIQFSPGVYQTFLVQTFAQQLETLYELGARRFLIPNMGPLGCIPSQLATKSKNGECIDYVNELVKNFNSGVRKLIEEMNADPKFSGATFLHGNIFDAVLNMIQNPKNCGFAEVKTGCCGMGRFHGRLTCLPGLAALCADRNQYIFWDAYHPTESVNVILAEKLFKGGLLDVYPLNISQLVYQE